MTETQQEYRAEPVKQICNRKDVNGIGCGVGADRYGKLVISPNIPVYSFNYCPMCGQPIRRDTEDEQRK